MKCKCDIWDTVGEHSLICMSLRCHNSPQDRHEALRTQAVAATWGSSSLRSTWVTPTFCSSFLEISSTLILTPPPSVLLLGLQLPNSLGSLLLTMTTIPPAVTFTPVHDSGLHQPSSINDFCRQTSFQTWLASTILSLLPLLVRLTLKASWSCKKELMSKKLPSMVLVKAQ